MARRKKVFGLPIGKKKSLIPKKALVAGAGLAAIPAAVGARKIGDFVSEGREGVEKATDIANKAGEAFQSISSHSSTLGKVGAAIGEVRKLAGDDGSGGPKLSHLIEENIEVAVPRQVAYNQWTQFETFPSITKGAEEVEQQERDTVRWTAKIGPSRRSWQGEITEQVPDERIAWKSSDGLQLTGVVTFHSLDDDLTRVLVQIEYDPRGAVETVGNLLRIQRRRVRRDLRLFKHFIELRGEETGAWRSRIAKKDGSSSSGRRGSRRSEGRSKASSRAKKAASSASKRATSKSQGRRSSSGGGAKNTGSRSSGARKTSSSTGKSASGQSRRSA